MTIVREFVETLLPLLAREGQVVIYSQWAGDGAGPRVFQDYIRARREIRFAFESVKTRTLVVKHTHTQTDRVTEGPNQRRLSASEAATSVARLIVAALMARQEPRRLALFQSCPRLAHRRLHFGRAQSRPASGALRPGADSSTTPVRRRRSAARLAELRRRLADL